MMKQIPYGTQWIDDEDINAVEEVLKTDWLTQGPKIEEFEEKVANYCGAKYAVAVNSGTSALHLACLVAGVDLGDEVITSPFTFVASANCVLYCKGKPIFADIQRDTLNIDPKEIEKKITNKTKTIIPVHFAGHPCDLEEIQTIAKKNNLIVIEDAAHALGAEYNGSKIGSCKYSDMTTLSFHPVKHITTGEGGMVLTNNKEYYEKILMFRTHGITKKNFKNEAHGEWYYEMQFLGYNYRITDIQAALGISQLKKLDQFISRRREIVEIYNQAFKDNEFFDLPVEKKGVKSSFHLFPIRLIGSFMGKRANIFSKMRKRGLGVQVHYIPVYLQPFYQQLGYKMEKCSKSEIFYENAISLPLYPAMKDEDVSYVIETVLGIFNGSEA